MSYVLLFTEERVLVLGWDLPEQDLVALVEHDRASRLEGYRLNPRDVEEHTNIETRLRVGGYRDRQIVEVVQNGVDAARSGAVEGRVEVLLTEDALYVANNGAPLTRSGVESLLHSHLSDKRDASIGRFGLGFKSLLGVSRHITVLSRSVSLEFEENRSREAIRSVVELEDAQGVPVTRLAWRVDAPRTFAEDSVAATFASWAATVVRARLVDVRAHQRLADAIDQFPPEFVLFAGESLQLKFSRGGVAPRTFAVARQGPHRVDLISGEATTTWRVRTRRVQITDEAALEDADELHQRDNYDLAWAVPEASLELGWFCAWFRINQERAPVPGALNAPWKTNDDRSNVLDGRFNDALMRELATLMVDLLPTFASPDDPAAPLDYLPRRDLQPGTAAHRLAGPVREIAKLAALVADGNGALRAVGELNHHPDVPVAVVEAWMRLAPAEVRARYLHPTCLKRDRLGRVKALSGEPRPTGLTEWLELVATAENGARVLDLVGSLDGSKLSREDREGLRVARIVPNTESALVPATHACLTDGAELPDGFSAVHPSLLEDDRSVRVLREVLGIRELAAGQWGEALRRRLDRATAAGWDGFWDLLRRAPRAAALEFLKQQAARVRVRRADGGWGDPALALTTGTVLEAAEAYAPANAPWVVDPAFHASDDWALDALGTAPVPSRSLRAAAMRQHNLWWPYHQAEVTKYHRWLASQGHSEKPWESRLAMLQPDRVPAPLDLLAKGTLAVRDRMTRWLLAQLDEAHGPVLFGHTTRGDYPRTHVTNPLSSLLEEHGVLLVEGRSLKVGDLLPFYDQPWTAALVTPAVAHHLGRLEAGFPQDAPPEPEGVRELWPTVFELAMGPLLDDAARLSLYATAGTFGHVPHSVSWRGREWQVADVLVVEGEPRELPELESMAILPMPAAACEAFLKRGAQRFNAFAPPVWLPVEEPMSPDEYEPALARHLTPQAPADLRIRLVRDLHRVYGGRALPLVTWREDSEVLVDVERLEALELQRSGAGIERVLRTLPPEWLSHTVAAVVASYLSDDVPRLRAEVAEAPDLPQRLLRAVGDARQLYRCLLPESHEVLEANGATPEQVATVVLNTHGPSTLKELSPVLEARGLEPPRRWGTATAAAFAEALGFPASFGGTVELRREPSLDVDGPVPLGPLHPFQRDVQRQVVEVLQGTDRRRMLVNLPTGAGKTRVTVQTLIEALRDRVVPSPILWVAQSDELCEQAVACFREVWSNFGTPRTRLRISRLWGGISRGVDHRPTPQVVVASIQTLVNRFENEGLVWLSQAGVVVIDEAHHATTKSYTALLDWLDRQDREAEPPIIGLTATAFKGFDESETRRLANRFDARLIPYDRTPADLMMELQERGVLARVRFLPLESGVEVSFTNDEESHIEQFSEIPPSALQRLASNEDRNTCIVDAILDRPAHARILVFALSVRHARALATELTLRGRTAASVDASTATATRRHLIGAFRDGSVPVLVNYGVLTTGFDAPMTDVILIARPTFSPNLYQQMIGRGLRGPANGGKPICELVTVEDNFGRYGTQLAFHHFRELFTNTERP